MTVRRRRGLIVATIVGAAIVVAAGLAVRLSGVDTHRNEPGAAPASSTPTPIIAPASTTSATPRAGTVTSGGPDVAMLKTDFAKLQSTIDGTIGLLIAPAGNAASPVTLGHWTVGPAWSTIKVPLVIAALRESDSPEITDAMRAAITESNNAAAESIWAGLGDPVTAAHTVEKVLVEAGDHTPVESRKVRPEFTAFGQTRWSLTDQLRFAAFAACDDRDAQVRALMGQIEQDQQWGLGRIPDTEFKGGWGPSEAGAYLVRQFGFVTNPSGGVSVVAVAVEPASGSFSDGTGDLTRIGDWLGAHIAMLPAGRCS